MSLTVKEINNLIQWVDDGFKPVKKPHGKGWQKQDKTPGKALTPVKIYDGNGLHLLVTPKGSRGWRYRYRFAGREKLISLGVYPKISLQRAREMRKAVEQQHADGLDPSVVARKRRPNRRPPEATPSRRRSGNGPTATTPRPQRPNQPKYATSGSSSI